MTLAVVHGLGILLVGLFHGYEYSGAAYHALGAVMAIIGCNLVLIVTGALARKNFSPDWLTAYSMLFGNIGIISAFLTLFYNFDYPAVVEQIPITQQAAQINFFR